MKYTIEKAEWCDIEHTKMSLNVIQAEDDNSKETRFFYVSVESDSAPLNILLRQMVIDENIPVIESDEVLRLTGKLPLQEGTRIINGVIFNDDAQAEAVRGEIDRQLARYMTPTAIIKAERDPVFAKKRQAQIDAFMEIENQPGFPYEIEWPEVV